MKTHTSKIKFTSEDLTKFAKLKISFVVPYFNEILGLELLENAKTELLKNCVKSQNIDVIRVSGALEIPFACKKISRKSKKTDAIIALGIIIRGETSHYELVTETTYQALMQIQLETGTPIIFGILACENIKQAKDRTSKNGLNKGKEFAEAALIQTNL